MDLEKVAATKREKGQSYAVEREYRTIELQAPHASPSKVLGLYAGDQLSELIDRLAKAGHLDGDGRIRVRVEVEVMES